MQDAILSLIDEFSGNSIAELIAVMLAIAYLILAVRENIACWYAAFASTLIFTVLFFDVRLYMESVLQVYYLGMAIYGWQQWRQTTDSSNGLRVTTWSIDKHVTAITVIVVASLLSTYLLERFTDARLPLLDSFTTWGAVVTTIMVARKILENWAYWLVIDGASIYLYLDRDLYFTAMLFLIYLVIIGFGWVSWHKSYKQHTTD